MSLLQRINRLGNHVGAKLWGGKPDSWQTWINHTLVSAATALIGAALGMAPYFALGACAFYWFREGLRHDFDSCMDRVGPTLVAVVAWLSG